MNLRELINRGREIGIERRKELRERVKDKYEDKED